MSDRFLYLTEQMINNADNFVVRYTVPKSEHYKGIKKEDVYQMAQVKRSDPGFTLIQKAFYDAKGLIDKEEEQENLEQERITFLRLKEKFEPNE